jgi:hypothetical protein
MAATDSGMPLAALHADPPATLVRFEKPVQIDGPPGAAADGTGVPKRGGATEAHVEEVINSVLPPRCVVLGGALLAALGLTNGLAESGSSATAQRGCSTRARSPPLEQTLLLCRQSSTGGCFTGRLARRGSARCARNSTDRLLVSGGARG